MINGKITIASVDYENSIRSLFPKLIQKSGTIENPGLAIRFLNKMGYDSLPIVLKIMEHISDTKKEELLLAVIEANRTWICETLNKFLETCDFGNAVQIDEIHAVKMAEKAGFSLVAIGVKIDYDALLRTDLVSQKIDSYADRVTEKIGGMGAGFLKGAAKFVLRTGARTAPETIEQKAVNLLNKEDNNVKVLKILKEGLEKIGLYLEIKDIVLIHVQEEQQNPKVIDEVIDTDMKFQLPESVEESLLDAVAAYLKETGC